MPSRRVLQARQFQNQISQAQFFLKSRSHFTWIDPQIRSPGGAFSFFFYATASHSSGHWSVQAGTVLIVVLVIIFIFAGFFFFFVVVTVIVAFFVISSLSATASN